MKSVPITASGAERLKSQLNTYKTVERQKIRKALEEARAHGDLKENAEYHAAKEAQGILEAKIGMIEQQLQEATIIDLSKIPFSGKVVFGATVTLINIEDESEKTYQIVGEAESDIELGLISITSPIAQACIGQSAEDVVSVTTPKGVIEYEIKAIEIK